ncbi:28S ribosomal protein S2, mitochondrial [Anthonomus grandis grandis]|uniref:28S ribosomal protein S2, mitochondrial n=1 Tax=Anthonomus grandis grandis TaxID=2921223 RepID=UPI0021663A9F|nr:28S ribosomal protein S2, mitochondrial [Anthonomus grandis grandis]
MVITKMLTIRKIHNLAEKCTSKLRFLSSAPAVQPIDSPLPQAEKPDIDVGSLRKEVLKHPDYFNVHNMFTVKDLFNAKVHYGHREGSLDNKMLPYIYGSRLGHIIFDLDKTAEYLRAALNITAHIAYRDGIILFFLRGAQNAHLVENCAKECGEFAHTRYWRGGIFTNSEKQFGAVTRLPDLCIFLNTLNDILAQHTAIRDSAKMGIATIGIVDSNCDPNIITYPVPGNDDSPSSIELYCKLFKEAIWRGKEKRKEHLGLK